MRAPSQGKKVTGKPQRRLIGPFSPALLAGAATLAAIVLSCRPSYSGQLESERDEDATLAFVGSTRQVGTLAPVPGVLITAELGNRRILVRSDPEGVYKLIPNFGADVKGDSVTISCAKDGFETVDVSRRELSSTKARELVVAECLLAPKP